MPRSLTASSLLMVCCLAASGSIRAESLEIVTPLPRQVVQRVGDVPQHSHGHAVGGPARGFADVEIVVRGSFGPESVGRVKVMRIDAPDPPLVDRKVAFETASTGMLRTKVRVPAGGWYRIAVEAHLGDRMTSGVIEPIGVGEVFLVAGQSYATNTNDESFRVGDPAGRVVAWDWRDGTWDVADDPQPTADASDGGSIWPPLGDQLVTLLQVPVGFANVAYGGTSSAQWMPDGELHRRLIDAGQRLGRFRAVLWQQGESDVIGKTATEQYVANLQAIRQAAVAMWKSPGPWLLAKSTLHPTVYQDPLGEARIRDAIDQLTRLPGFAPGPDTDLLDGERRGPIGSRRHFSGAGQRQAAQLWFAAIWAQLQRPRPEHEIARFKLADLHLTEYPWRSSVIHGETSVLLADDQGQNAVARLAFPAAEIRAIEAANGSHTYVLDTDASLSDDGRTLRFVNPGPVTALRPADMYLPLDAPGSYQHRVDHPDQGLLYAPGRGFLDRDVAISYRRRDSTWNGPVPEIAGQLLPKTLQRLRDGQPIRLGVSGDSISFGWDASRMSDAPPHQFAYPALVAAQLTESFGSEVELINRAVSGWSIVHGLEDLPKLLAERPDLVLVAYGMNDVGRRDPAWFGQQAKAMVDAIRQAAPDVEIILVAPMLGNREWIHTPAEMFPRYRDEMARLIGPGVALADVTGVWQTLLDGKHDLDLTGNGLNHPNDFGHRLYAQVILALMLDATQ